MVLCLAAAACPGGSSGDDMPDVVGKSEADAKKILADLGLTVEATRKRTGATAGTVTDQSPHAGDAIPDDEKVTIVVEDVAVTGAVVVPDVVGKPLHEADAALQAAGFTRGRLEKQLSEKPGDTVLAQDPRAGTNTPSETLVNLIVADSVLVTVPNVVGQDEASAIKLLAEKSLQVGNVERTLQGTGAAGTVVDQNPGAELQVARNSPVKLVLKEDGVTIPNVMNRPLAEVSTLLLNSPLDFNVVYKTDTSPGMIVDVVPPPGQLVPRFSPVTLTVTKLLGPFGRGVHQAESVLLEQLRRSRGRINK
jgi:beta-lactam-binding protein with PASTA domain